MNAIDALLKQNDAVLIRQNKHLIYRLPNGALYTRSSTPGGSEAERKDLAILRRLLKDGERLAKVGERRARKARTQSQPIKEKFKKADMNPTLADQLRLTGATEAALRAEIDSLHAQIEQLQDENFALETVIEAVKAIKCDSWWCKLKRRFGWG